ncbi:hypothetical protein DMB44_04270 [Thermoplasma sp. Kam2015]|nr:hypothetical protein DMB44_04270 [Thermoplasma sp. Kam2015]
MFFETAKMLSQEGSLGEALYLLEADGDSAELREYFSLVALYFKDEGGYKRSLFIPLPVVLKSRTAGAKKIREALQSLPEEHIVSRDWHDVEGKTEVPTGYYPPEPEDEEVGEEEDDEEEFSD